MKYWEAFKLIRQVRDEYLVARFALAFTLRHVAKDPTLLQEVHEPATMSTLRDCAARLEVTYVLRLFAAFEGVLRGFWASVRPAPRPRRTKMEVLMQRISIECQIPHDIAEKAHTARKWRNAIVHPQAPLPPLTFDQCKSRLAYFLSYLPREW
jgi:hypothetical protein